MKKMAHVAAATAAALMVLASPAAAGTSTFSAETTQFAIVGVSGDPGRITAECPPGFLQRQALIIESRETVQVESAVFNGTMTTILDQHCSVPRPPVANWGDGSRAVTPIEMEAGHMTLQADNGDLLYLDYRGPGVLKGDIFGLNTHTFNGPFTITGGTGVFTGASGHGHLAGQAQATATGFTGGWNVNGEITVPG
jgi:hypothetical protein